MAKPLTPEKELEQAAGLKQAKTEQRAVYLRRVLDSIAKLPEEQWDKLTAESRQWYDDGVTATEKNEDVPDFPGHQAEEADMAKKDTKGESKDKAAAKAAPKTAPKKAAAKKAAAKPKVAVKKAAAKAAPKKIAAEKAPVVKTTKPKVKKDTNGTGRHILRVNGITSAEAIRRETWDSPGMTEEDMHQKLKKDFPSLTIGTVSTMRSTTRAVMMLDKKHASRVKAGDKVAKAAARAAAEKAARAAAKAAAA